MEGINDVSFRENMEILGVISIFGSIGMFFVNKYSYLFITLIRNVKNNSVIFFLGGKWNFFLENL